MASVSLLSVFLVVSVLVTSAVYHSLPVSSASRMEMDFVRMRRDMIARTIAARGVTNAHVLEAMNAVKREDFVPPDQQDQAYDDNALPIGAGQTISQPYIVALMADAMKIKATDRVLDVGTGCGYAAAVLARLAKEVHSIERIPSLARTAEDRLQRLGYRNVRVYIGDGSVGLPEHAPFDAIAVAAGSPQIPASLVNQLVEGGRIVIPLENKHGHQDLVVGVKHGSALKVKDLGGVRFVPLLGEEGFKRES